VEQAASSVDRLARHVTAHDDFRLAALSAATRTSGSLVIALALSHAELGADEAWHASRIDEAWQREAWGADAEDEVRACALRAELAAAARFMALLDG